MLLSRPNSSQSVSEMQLVGVFRLMEHTTTDNVAACLHCGLVLGIMLLGLVIMCRGFAVVGWLVTGLGYLVVPFVGVISRGLVVMAILCAIYVVASQRRAALPKNIEPDIMTTQHGESTRTHVHQH